MQRGDADFERDARVRKRRSAPRQALVVGLPTKQAREESDVRALAFMRRRERTLGVELDQHFLRRAAAKIAREAADAHRRGGMRTRRPAHHGTDDVIEDAGRQGGRHGGRSGVWAVIEGAPRSVVEANCRTPSSRRRAAQQHHAVATDQPLRSLKVRCSITRMVVIAHSHPLRSAPCILSHSSRSATPTRGVSSRISTRRNSSARA